MDAPSRKAKSISRQITRMTRPAALLGVLILSAPFGCANFHGVGRVAPSAADSLLAFASLHEVVERFVMFEHGRKFALRTGIEPRTGEVPFVSASDAHARARFARAAVRQLDAINVDALAEPDYVTWFAVRTALTDVSDLAPYIENDLTPFMIGGSPVLAAARTLSETHISDSRDMERYLTIVLAIGAYADRLEGDLRDRALHGIVLSRGANEEARRLPAMFTVPAGESLLHPRAERTSALAPGMAKRFVATVDSVIDAKITPAYQRLSTFLARRGGEQAPSGVGLWQYVGGKEYYRVLVRVWTSLDITPEQAYQAGVREVARLDPAIRTLRVLLGGPAQADSVQAWLQSDARFAAVPPDSVVDRILVAQSRLGPELSVADSMPQSQIVVGVPWLPPTDRILGEYRGADEATGVARYRPGPVLEERGASAMIDAISFYAIKPGIHAILGRQLNPSLFTARLEAAVPAFTQGWGLYAVESARASGAIPHNSVEELGALMLEMIASVRVVVDVGIHWSGWSEAQGVEYIRRFTWLSDSSAMAEVRRIAYDAPGSGLAAGMGLRELLGVRAWMERELKSDFDLRRFNAELASLGPIPLPAVGLHFEWWLWKERARLRAERAPSTSKPKSDH